MENIYSFKNIIEDWLLAFPSLKKINQKFLFKIIGPCIVGFELLKIKDTQEYRVYFSIYKLWGENINECLKSPVVYFDIVKNNGDQFDVPFSMHKILFYEILNLTNKQIPFDLNSEISTSSIHSFIDKYKDNKLIIAQGDLLKLKLYEFELFIALYINDIVRIDQILNEIDKKRKTWNYLQINLIYGNYSKWFDSTFKYLKNRDMFIQIIESNTHDPSISKLNFSELVK